MEGAYAAVNLLWDFLERYFEEAIEPELAVAAWSAIARHHSAGASNLSDFIMKIDAKEYIEKSIREIGFKDFSIKQIEDRPSMLIRKTFGEKDLLRTSEGGEKYFPFYWLAVRLLRLADQSSQKKGISDL
jgi:hypothetical protein